MRMWLVVTAALLTGSAWAAPKQEKVKVAVLSKIPAPSDELRERCVLVRRKTMTGRVDLDLRDPTHKRLNPGSSVA